MADLIDRQALLGFLDDITNDEEWLVSQYNADWIYSWIDCEPAVDAVEVVRCKDCKYCVLTVDGEYNPQDIVCEWWQTDGLKTHLNFYSNRSPKTSSKGCWQMEQYKIGNATVRIHGIPDRAKIEAATVTYLKAAQQQRKKARSNQKNIRQTM